MHYFFIRSSCLQTFLDGYWLRLYTQSNFQFLASWKLWSVIYEPGIDIFLVKLTREHLHNTFEPYINQAKKETCYKEDEKLKWNLCPDLLIDKCVILTSNNALFLTTEYIFFTC